MDYEDGQYGLHGLYVSTSVQYTYYLRGYGAIHKKTYRST